jgi:hypothetical protein
LIFCWFASFRELVEKLFNHDSYFFFYFYNLLKHVSSLDNNKGLWIRIKYMKSWNPSFDFCIFSTRFRNFFWQFDFHVNIMYVSFKMRFLLKKNPNKNSEDLREILVSSTFPYFLLDLFKILDVVFMYKPIWSACLLLSLIKFETSSL